MPAYAPSNAQTVTVNPPHGCGRPHERGGASVMIVDCPPCHKHLTGVLGWGATFDQLPETPDEKRERESAEERGMRDRDKIAVDAVNALSGMPGALEALTAFLVAQGQAQAADQVRCANGHSQPVSARFCSECAAPMGELILAVVPDAPGELPAAPQEAVPAPEPAPPVPPAEGRKPRLRDMRLEELQALARERGVPDYGTRAQIIARLKDGR